MTEQVKANIAERLLFLGIGAAEKAHLARIRPQALGCSGLRWTASTAGFTRLRP